MWAILKKEVKSYFYSPIGYVFIGLFLIMSSIFFYLDVVSYGSAQFETMFYSASTILTFIVPVLTMRMFAEERKSGTEQLLYTSPKSITQIVLGKFLSAVIVIAITELFTILYYIILSLLGKPHMQTALVTLFGFLLLSMAYISFGMFASSITENQIIAGILTIGFFVITWFLPNFSTTLSTFSLINMFDKFPSGLIAVEEIVRFVSFTVLFILLTIIVLQKRRNVKYFKETTKTVLIIAILIALFIAINVLVGKMDLPDIDVTQNKLYTLTEESKQKVKDIQEEIHVYFVGVVENSPLVDLMKQYTKVNEKITYEVIEDITTRPEISTKYSTESDTIMVITTNSRNKVLSYSDLYTYDYTTYEQVDISEQKMTNAMLDLTIENKPVVYFLTGHNEYSTQAELTRLVEGLENDVNTVKTLDLLVTQKIPEDATAIVIGTPGKDFEISEAELLIGYIKNGGKILWLNDPDFTGVNYSNIQKVLDEFGVKFDNGIVIEQDSNKMVLQTGNFILPQVEYTNATRSIATDGGVMLVNSGKISLEESEKLEELGVEAEAILTTSQNSLFRTDTSNGSTTKLDTDLEGSFTLAYKLTKTVENNKAEMYVIANNIFASDAQVKVQNNYSYSVEFYNNKDFVLNIIADLTNREDSITIRKDTGIVTYTATKQQDIIIKSVIFGVPVLIVIVGVVVWQLRRRKH